MKNIKTVNLRGKRFSISRSRRLNPDILGWCRHHKKPKIVVAYSLDGIEELEILLHEMLHGCYWDMDEEAITDTAQSISKALWRMGYRKEVKNSNKNATPRRRKARSKRK